MRTNRTQSFRLHHISKMNSSLRKQSQTFYQPDESIKLAAINSVNRGVKYNDLSFLTGRQLNKLRKEPLETNDKFYESAHINLTDVRKKYDDMKKQRVDKEYNIYNLKGQIEKYQIFQEDYEHKIQNAQSKVKDHESILANKKYTLEETLNQKKILMYMQNRLKMDRVHYDQKQFDYQKELNYLQKQLAIIQREGNETGQSSNKTLQVYAKLMKQLELQRQQRLQHLTDLQNIISRKKELIEANEKRQNQIQEIAERAMQDKDFNEKQWNKILITHCFVGKMLRNKIQKEMDKFKVVEFSFKQIKTATGVSDAKSLVSKYLNKETVYGELLGKIAENEKKIEELKAETEGLIKGSKQHEVQRDVILSTKIKQVDLHHELKELERTNEKKLQVDGFKAKMKSWIKRQLKKIITIENVQEKVPQITHQEIAKAINTFLKKLTVQLESAEGEIVNEENEPYVLQSRDLEKVTRIMMYKKVRKNSMGEDILDADEEETIPSTNNEELQMIYAQREEVVKSNERFMKQLRKKYEEIRKVMTQKVDKKDKVKLVEAKKVTEEKI